MTEWILFNPSARSLFGKSFLPSIARSFVSFRSKDRRRVISRRQKIFSLRILMFVGDSKWFILFLEWTVPVRWISKSILSSQWILLNLTREWNNFHCIQCFLSSWFDEDGIKDYSLDSLSTDSFGSSRRTLIGFSSDPSIFLVYLRSGISSSRSLIVVIRDEDDCLAEWTNLSSIVVQEDPKVFEDFLRMIEGQSTLNFFLWTSEQRKSECKWTIISSLTRQINQLDEDNLRRAIFKSIFDLFFFFFSFRHFRWNSFVNHFCFLVRFFARRQESVERDFVVSGEIPWRVESSSKIREFLSQFQLKQSITTLKSPRISSDFSSSIDRIEQSIESTRHRTTSSSSSSSLWSIGVFRATSLFDV